jgi:hypothetical protein
VVLSAGLLEYLIPNNTKKEAKISVVDSIASAISAYELPKKPAVPLIRAKQAFP